MAPGDHIRDLLTQRGVPFEVLAHRPAATAQQAAEARGTPLAIGGKTLLMKLDRGIGFALLVVGGDRAVDNRRLRAHLRVRRYRFATPGELRALTGLQPGCLPPFGHPVFDLPLYVDAARAALEPLAFSLASPTLSVRMATADWLAVARPTDVFPFSRETGP